MRKSRATSECERITTCHALKPALLGHGHGGRLLRDLTQANDQSTCAEGGGGGDTDVMRLEPLDSELADAVMNFGGAKNDTL